MADHDGQANLSLVIPAYNEAPGIAQAIAEAAADLPLLAANYEILIVDDGSTDGTADAVLQAAQAHSHVRLLRHERNRGYGAALRTGFEAARFERIAFTDADCQFHLGDLATLLPLTAEHPIAVGYRLARQDPWQRRFFSWGYNTLVRALLGTRARDCDCALKVFRKEALAELLPQTPGFFVNTEMLTRARQRGYRVAEMGVRHRPRLHGSSKVSLLDIPRTLRTLLPFWWSRVLFAGGDQSSVLSAQCSVLNTCWHLLTLILVAGLLFFSRLGAPLQEPDEVRYAEIPRQMLEEGRWVVPVLHGLPYPDKPPLLYWLVMASYRVFGVEDWAARLVPSGAAFLVVLVSYFWGRRVFGPRAGFAGALILCLSARFVYLGRLLTMDSLLALWVVLSLAAAHVAIGAPRWRRGWLLLAALACGLGLLTKGPVALALIACPLVLFQLLDPRPARLGWQGWSLFLGGAAAAAVPWYAAMCALEPSFFVYFFWKHNVVRFVAPFDHPKPFWFHLPGLLLGMLPWTVLLPGLVRFLARRSARTAVRRPAALGLLLLAFLWCVLFYSAAGCKRAVYILPAIPPLALALGCYLDVLVSREMMAELLERARRRLPARQLAFRATTLVLVAGLVGSLLAGSAGFLTPPTAVALASVGAVGMLVLLIPGGLPRVHLAWAGCAAATFAVLVAAIQLVLPGYARKFSLRGQVRPYAEHYEDSRMLVACYPHRWDSVSFYLRRSDVIVFRSEQKAELIDLVRARPDTLLVVKSEGPLEELRASLWSASLQFVPRGRQGTVTLGVVQPGPSPEDMLLVRKGVPDHPKARAKIGPSLALRAGETGSCGLPCSGSGESLVFAEIELLRSLFAQRIAHEPATADWAQVVAEVLVRRLGEVRVGDFVLHVAQQLADRLHVVGVEVRFGDLSGVLGGKNFDLDHVMVVLSRPKLLAAEITRHVQHERLTLP